MTCNLFVSIAATDKYFLKDPEGEKKHKFKLEDALRRAQSSDKKLLEGHTFYFTKGLHKSEKLVTYKNVISSAGGKVRQSTKFPLFAPVPSLSHLVFR